MNRGLATSLCAAAMFCIAASAMADVNVQLNLQYNDPNDAASGGTWELLAMSTAGENVVGIKADIGGDTGVTGVDTGEISSAGGVWDNATNVFRYQLLTGGDTEVVAGDNLDGTVTTFAAAGGKDDLYPIAANSWDGSELLASGSWTGDRPTLANVEANVWDGADATVGTVGTVSVRGDSVGVDGILQGDANRDGIVNGDDFNLLAFSFGNAGTTWDQGNFDSVNGTNGDDFNLLAFNFGNSAVSPAVGAVPEPSTIALVGLGALSMLAVRRRK